MIPHRPVAALLLAAAAIAEDAPAPAQAPAPAAPAAQAAAPTVDPAQAIRLALDRHEDPKIAAARIQRAQATVARARAALLPQITIGGSLATSSVNEIPSGGEATETQSWNAQASMSLFKASALSNVAATKFALQAQEMDSVQIRRSLAFSVLDVYLTVIAAEHQVGAAERRLGVSQSSVADAKARLQAGLSTRTDVTRAELEEAQAQLSVTQARRSVTASRLALADLIVAPLAGGLAAPAEIEVPSRDGDALSRLATLYRPDLKALDYRESAAYQSVRAAYGGYVPSVSAVASATHANTNSAAAQATDDKTLVTLSLVASWDLWDGGDREGSLGQAQADRLEANLNRTAQLRSLRKDLLTALADLDTAEASLAQAQARDRLARANAEEIRARYKQGLATALEDADAISSQFEAESGLVSSRLDLQRSRLAIRRLAGMWPLTDREPGTRP